jgi:ComF family protein
MINKLLQIIAPHHCYGCHKTGTLLCDNCKYDIVDESFEACIVCLSPSSVGICEGCRTSYERAWFVGERTQVLERLIDALKFKRARSSSESLAALLDMRLPALPSDVVIVPVPTLRRHIRQRGYDHCLLIAQNLSARRGAPIERLIDRRTLTVQLGKNKKDRLSQAKESFVCSRPLDPERTYLLVDDVVTTNATVRYAAAALRDAGAQRVWVGVVARQPLEKQR